MKTMNWVNNKILNKTGLATAIWDDNKPDILRKRLMQKNEIGSLTDKERDKIIAEIENLLKQTKKQLLSFKKNTI